jgi:hypothetical protein
VEKEVEDLWISLWKSWVNRAAPPGREESIAGARPLLLDASPVTKKLITQDG